MTQTRIWNYGDTFTSARASLAQRSLNLPGVYSGFDPNIVDVDKIALSPGALLLPSGIMVTEDLAIPFVIAPLPAAATNYTLTVRHTDTDLIGGQAATYQLELGLLTTVSNGLPLAYIKHPGGAVPLQPYFVLPVRKVLASAADAVALEPTVSLAPFSSKWVTSVLGPNSSISDLTSGGLVFTRVSANALAPAPPGFETTTSVLPFSLRRDRPVSVTLRILVEPNCTLSVAMRDTNGAYVTLTGNTIGPVGVFTDHVVSVSPSSGVFTAGGLFNLEFSFNVPSLAGIQLQSVVIDYDPLP